MKHPKTTPNQVLEEPVVPTEGVTEETQPLQATEQPTEHDMLVAFAELVSERYGYDMGRRLTQQDMAEKCKKQLTAVREESKLVSERIEKYLEEATDALRSDILASRKKLEELKKVAAEKTQPFRAKIKPLVQAVRYCDAVAVPDFIKELNTVTHNERIAVAPRFKLADWIAKSIVENKKKKTE